MRISENDVLHHIFIDRARSLGGKLLYADSTGKELSYRKALLKSIVLSDCIKRRCPDEEMIGIMMPSTVAGAVVNIAVQMAGKVPVNLNFTAAEEAIKAAVEQCGIRSIFTARAFLEKTGMKQTDDMILLEDFAESITLGTKLKGALKAFFLPKFLLRRMYGGDKKSGDLATVIFSSGSTGVPKGIMLTHANIISNIKSCQGAFNMKKDEVFCGVLPFFHSFGFTVTLWLPVLIGITAVYHPNPLEARKVGELICKYGCTFFISTPTFLRNYIRSCEPGDFGSLRQVIVGAEKLKKQISDAFFKKFGIHPVEGYGVTECAPVISVNTPDVRAPGIYERNSKEGTVGRSLPGIDVKTIDPDTLEDLPRGERGVLCIKGLNVMTGYLKDEEKTSEVFRDGWYVTGDIAEVDEDGFITIHDRLSRFSKIAGEMVPHLAVEDAINELIDAEEPQAFVTAVPDLKRGERLAVVHLPLEESVDEIWEKLNASSLPKLYIPRKDSFIETDYIPVLGTGKIALQELKRIALSRLGGATD